MQHHRTRGGDGTADDWQPAALKRAYELLDDGHVFVLIAPRGLGVIVTSSSLNWADADDQLVELRELVRWAPGYDDARDRQARAVPVIDAAIEMPDGLDVEEVFAG